MAEQYPDAIIADVLFDLTGKTAAEVVIEIKKRLNEAGFVIKHERQPEIALEAETRAAETKRVRGWIVKKGDQYLLDPKLDHEIWEQSPLRAIPSFRRSYAEDLAQEFGGRVVEVEMIVHEAALETGTTKPLVRGE